MPLCKENKLGQNRDFCIGPIADHRFWSGKRAGLPLYRVPWRSPVAYFKFVADKEIQCAHEYGKPREPGFPYNAIGFGVQQPEDLSQLRRRYQTLTPHLLPKDEARTFNRPVLRHPNSKPGNVYIHSDTGSISLLIGWQHAVVQPHILAAGYPRVFENPLKNLPRTVKILQLPKDLAALPQDDQVTAHDTHRHRLLSYYYRGFSAIHHRAHFEAFSNSLRRERQLLVDQAGRQWEGSNIVMKVCVLHAT